MRPGTIFAASLTVLVLTVGASVARTRISVWDGVYTDAQAERGHRLYMQSCARCHGVNLWGTYEIPPLVGRFMPYWSGAKLDALFDYVGTAMPLDRPGALGPGANVDIVAFILKSNDIPAGSAELSADRVKAINFDAARFSAKHARK